ncbi:hypothetical protein DM2_2756 [Halorubrum sp. DM2]|nr:hypothetical protein DM2_2756 [Halorubrum sp. DM2]
MNESDTLETDNEDIDLFPEIDAYDSPDDVPGLADENSQ